MLIEGMQCYLLRERLRYEKHESEVTYESNPFQLTHEPRQLLHLCVCLEHSNGNMSNLRLILPIIIWGITAHSSMDKLVQIIQVIGLGPEQLESFAFDFGHPTGIQKCLSNVANMNWHLQNCFFVGPTLAWKSSLEKLPNSICCGSLTKF